MIEHQHLIVRAEINNPIISINKVEKWIEDIIEKLNMKIMMGPFAKYCNTIGNRGITCVAIIETSHVVLHIWDEDKPGIMQLDVYTCSSLDKQIIFDAIELFEPTRIDYKYLDRKHNLTLLG